MQLEQNESSIFLNEIFKSAGYGFLSGSLLRLSFPPVSRNPSSTDIMVDCVALGTLGTLGAMTMSTVYRCIFGNSHNTPLDLTKDQEEAAIDDRIESIERVKTELKIAEAAIEYRLESAEEVMKSVISRDQKENNANIERWNRLAEVQHFISKNFLLRLFS